MKQSVKWQRSFRYAYEGVKYALATQRNMKFHFFAALVILALALFFGLPKTDILFILLAVTLMIVTELINTAVEKAVDLAMPDLHPLAKIAKDVAAASVLVTAAFAAVTGMIVFYDPIERLIQTGRAGGHPITAGTVWILLSLVILTVIVVQTRFSAKGNGVKPSLLTAVAFAVAALIACRVQDTLVALLGFLLAVVLLLALHDKRKRPFGSLLLGAVLGGFITVLAYYLYPM
ncbi:diacylglycerol kinase family protein [Paenibacillus ehimensis]|uniref:Diacylglycerol kinase family protein n=1 Tax=Paenibacillus ehimensis TaxID=79264 RepID=A0ABT8VB50_9BACL|nr:diacylglycerol kinase family protein [Paenibacillus ehimensis]MDO3678198.1 diacylglycerol kinase family protein [Paenibacillus ehimensis]